MNQSDQGCNEISQEYRITGNEKGNTRKMYNVLATAPASHQNQSLPSILIVQLLEKALNYKASSSVPYTLVSACDTFSDAFITESFEV